MAGGIPPRPPLVFSAVLEGWTVVRASGWQEMSLFISSADAMSGNLSKMASKASLWTVTWPLWQYNEEHGHPNEPDVSVAVPIVWLRHDRSLGLMRGAACVLVNNIEVKVSDGVTPEPVAGQYEVLKFELFGKPATVTLTTIKTSALQQFVQMNYTYELAIDGEVVPQDCSAPPPAFVRGTAAPPSAADRVTVREFRVVAQRGATGEWTSDMVTEYAICSARDCPEARQEGGTRPCKLMRWARFSEFDTLHSQLYSCFPSNEAKRLPSLPSKTWLPKGASSSGDAFNTARAEGLQKYLQAMLSLPRGPRLPYLRRFLGFFDVAEDTGAPPFSVKRGVGVRVLSPRGILRSCTVVECSEGQVLVHYEGYHQQYDEWISGSSTRLKPADRTAAEEKEEAAARAGGGGGAATGAAAPPPHRSQLAPATPAPAPAPAPVDAADLFDSDDEDDASEGLFVGSAPAPATAPATAPAPAPTPAPAPAPAPATDLFADDDGDEDDGFI